MAANHAAIMRITSRHNHPSTSKEGDDDVCENSSSEDQISHKSGPRAGIVPEVEKLDLVENVDEINYFLG